MRCALGSKGDKCRGEMADGTCPKDVEEDNECRRASATAGCHVTPIHSLKTESYGLNFRGCSYHTTTCYSESILLCSSTRERRFMCSEAGMKPLGNVRCQTVMAEMMLTRGISSGIDCFLDISLNSRDKVPRVIIPLR